MFLTRFLRKVIFFDQWNVIQWEILENQNPRISSESWETTQTHEYYFAFFVTVVLYVNLVWLSVHVCVDASERVCVRLFSGLSHRSLRCLADFYADGLINGWETLVLHRGSLLSVYQHTTWHTHTLTSTYTQQTCGHEKKAQANSFQPYQSKMKNNLLYSRGEKIWIAKSQNFILGVGLTESRLNQKWEEEHSGHFVQLFSLKHGFFSQISLSFPILG